MRKKDVVLMATVTSFESLPHPSRSELRQFAELFSPLFSASSDEARRDAVAALSQCGGVPQAVAYFIASQPISVAAPFLTSSPSLSDEALVAIARTQGEAHARAIVRREALSPTVIDALVGLRHDRTIRRSGSPAADSRHAAAGIAETAAAPQPPVPVPLEAPQFEPAQLAPSQDAPTRLETRREEADRLTREEKLRQRIKSLAAHIDRPADDRLGLRNLSPIQQALLVRFARNREAGLFATVLADTLSASRWLAERILLDISGQQLATTLKGLAMQGDDALFILQRLYDHLSTRRGGVTRAALIWDALDEDECGTRLEAWRRADSYTYAHAAANAQPMQAPTLAADNDADANAQDIRQALPRIIRTTATARRPLTRAR